MRIGLFAPLTSPFATPEYLAALGPAAEERGFHSIWVAEHVVLFDEYASRYPYAENGKIPAGGEHGILEPFTALAFLAAATDRIRLGTGICLVPQRNPVYTGKEVAAVDWLSNGRFDFGIGVGWLAEEYAAVAVPFDHRGDRCREYVEVMKRLWSDEVSAHKGRYYELPACRQYPKPAQRPHPPIHFGGESDAALRRVADLGQGWYTFNRLPDDVPERLAALGRLLEERGRSRSEVEISLCPYLHGMPPGSIERYAEAGVDQVTAVPLAFDRDSLLAALDDLVKTAVEPAARL